MTASREWRCRPPPKGPIHDQTFLGLLNRKPLGPSASPSHQARPCSNAPPLTESHICALSWDPPLTRRSYMHRTSGFFVQLLFCGAFLDQAPISFLRWMRQPHPFFADLHFWFLRRRFGLNSSLPFFLPARKRNYSLFHLYPWVTAAVSQQSARPGSPFIERMIAARTTGGFCWTTALDHLTPSFFFSAPPFFLSIPGDDSTVGFTYRQSLMW